MAPARGLLDRARRIYSHSQHCTLCRGDGVACDPPRCTQDDVGADVHSLMSLISDPGSPHKVAAAKGILALLARKLCVLPRCDLRVQAACARRLQARALRLRVRPNW